MAESTINIPKRLVLIAGLCCLIGALAFYDFVLSLIYFKHISVNLAWLLIPVGLGLFLGKQSALMWAKIWCLIAYVLLGFVIVIFFAYPGMIKVDIDGKSYYGEDNLLIAILLCLTYLVGITLIHVQLYHHKVTAFIHSKLNPHTRARLDRIRKRAKK